jgi:tRNA(Arg) A34 adenosine deaminase TadA
MLRFMNEAIIEARREPLRGGVGAVLVNPETNEIVARAHDLSRAIDPVDWRCARLAEGTAATRANGGAGRVGPRLLRRARRRSRATLPVPRL